MPQALQPETGSVRGWGWSRLDASKHLFGIYLSEALISPPFFLVRARGMCGSQHRFPPRTKLGHWTVLRANTGSGVGFFFLPWFCSMVKELRTHRISLVGREQADGAKGCPTCCCSGLWILPLIFTCHHCNPQRYADGNMGEDTHAVLERLQRVPLSPSRTGI